MRDDSEALNSAQIALLKNIRDGKSHWSEPGSNGLKIRTDLPYQFDERLFIPTIVWLATIEQLERNLDQAGSNECTVCDGEGEVHQSTSIPGDEGFVSCPTCGGSGERLDDGEIAELRGKYEEAAGDLRIVQNEKDAILQEAKIWAQEAKTQRATVNEVGSTLGGMSDWGPISATVKAALCERAGLQLRVQELEALLSGEPLIAADFMRQREELEAANA